MDPFLKHNSYDLLSFGCLFSAEQWDAADPHEQGEEWGADHWGCPGPGPKGQGAAAAQAAKPVCGGTEWNVFDAGWPYLEADNNTDYYLLDCFLCKPVLSDWLFFCQIQ